MKRCNVGIFADRNGYSMCTLIFENRQYHLVQEDFDTERVSIRDIRKNLEQINKQYRIERINVTNLPTLIQELHKFKKICVCELNVSDGLFAIASHLNDEKLFFTHNQKGTLITSINSFVDLEAVNHRIFALMITLQNFCHPIDNSWRL